MLGSFPFVVFGRIGSASWRRLGDGGKNSVTFALSPGMALRIRKKTLNSNILAFYSSD